MNVQINLWAVVLATVASMVIGFIWYMPSVFGNVWMKLTKLDPKEMKARGSAAGPIVTTIIVSLITAYVLAHMAYLSHHFFNNSFFQDSVTTAFWAWLGFTVARFVTHDVFEGRPVKLTVLNSAHELVTIIAMGAVIGWMGV